MIARRKRAKLAVVLAVVAVLMSSLGDARAAESPPTPFAATDYPSIVGTRSATLGGSVNPDGSAVTDCHFEVGTGTSYGTSVACAQSVAAGTGYTLVSAQVSGLQPGTLYHYRLVASDGGTAADGADVSFSTAPAARPIALITAGTLEGMTVTFRGYVDALGFLVTTCLFEYGVTVAYGSSVPCAQSVGAGTGEVPVSAQVSGLQPGTLYYYRLVASTAEGTDSTPYFTLTTPSVSEQERTVALARCVKLSGSQRDRCFGAIPNWGIYTAYCPLATFSSYRANPAPRGGPDVAPLRARLASTSEAGWPPHECLKMDKGRAGLYHTIVGEGGIHNWLLGGYGNDTIIGGNDGDVIWADYQPSGWPKHQTAIIHAGNGRNVIYANDTVNYVWTGTNPRTVVHAHEDSGTIHCENPHIVVFTSHAALKHFKLAGCKHISFYSVGY